MQETPPDRQVPLNSKQTLTTVSLPFLSPQSRGRKCWMAVILAAAFNRVGCGMGHLSILTLNQKHEGAPRGLVAEEALLQSAQECLKFN